MQAMIKLSIRIFLFFNVLFECSGYAAEYQLFTQINNPVLAYDEIIQNLNIGDQIKFSNGESLTIAEMIGHGNSHFIFSPVEYPDQIVRIPLKSGKMPTIWQYVEGEKLLSQYNIQHPKVNDFYNNEWVRTDRIFGPLLTFDQFVEFYRPRFFGFLLNEKTDSVEYQVAVYELKQFAQSIALFGRLGDFHSGNLVYDRIKEKWILIDWHELHRLATSVEQSSPFDPFVFEFGTLVGREFTPKKREYQFLQPLFAELVDIIRSERLIYFTERSCEYVFIN